MLENFDPLSKNSLGDRLTGIGIVTIMTADAHVDGCIRCHRRYPLLKILKLVDCDSIISFARGEELACILLFQIAALQLFAVDDLNRLTVIHY